MKSLETFLKSFEIKSVDEEYNEVEDRFWDPNLLIKIIEEMNLKQQEDIVTVQLNLSELNLINDDLKASNQFEPFNFNKDFFGQLKLNKYSGFDPFTPKSWSPAVEKLKSSCKIKFEQSNQIKRLLFA